MKTAPSWPRKLLWASCRILTEGTQDAKCRGFYCWNLPAKVDQNLVSIVSRIKREISARPCGRRLEVSWAVNLAREDFSLESSTVGA